MRKLDITNDNMLEAADIIKSGGLVAFPTETVYGLGANGLDPVAAAKIFEAKKRPKFDPLILHVSSKDAVDKLCRNIDPRAYKLIDKFWPGPLTVILNKSDIVPDIITSGLPTVAVRMPKHPVAHELIKLSETAIAAPSANLFGHLSPTNYEHVIEQLDGRVDAVLQEQVACEYGVESTVISFAGETPMILRYGAISREEIETEIGSVDIRTSKQDAPQAPGQLLSHYAPRIPLRVITDPSLIDSDKRKGLLAFKPSSLVSQFSAVEVLSGTGDLMEAAMNLFSCLHKLEKADIDVIYAEGVPREGIGNAIMDRLFKAEGLGNE